MKICKRCCNEKGLASFSKDKRSKDGLYLYCKDCCKEAGKKWHSENSDRKRQNARNWLLKNSDKKRNYNRARNARIRGVTSEPYTESEVIELYGTTCHLCGFAIDMNAPRKTGLVNWERGLHVDHVIPISMGGPNILSNVRPSHALCNLRKSNKLPSVV
jgi:5-methylcytosine-specific restriction endonuclease McrA